MSRTRTNYEACEQVQKYWIEHPEIEFGFMGDDEIKIIEDAFELKECSVIDLRNARDFSALKFTVNQFTADSKELSLMKLIDCKSAIVHVIDLELIARGEDIGI